jgi:hypothetical protein
MSSELKNLEKQVAEQKAIPEIKKARVSESTLKQYLTRVKKVHSLMFKKSMTDTDWLKDYQKVISFILSNETWKTKQSKATYINSLTSYLRNSKELPEAYKKYSEINKVFTTNIQKDKSNNKMTDKEAEVMIPWTEIKSLTSNITNPEDSALVGVYTLIPPRRVDDYRLMKVFIKKKGRDVPADDTNYLVLNTRKNPESFVFNKYKTDKYYGQQTVRIPTELKTIIKKYIGSKTLSNSSCLFGARDGSCLSQPGFTSKIRNVFKKYTDKPLTINSLRHSFISGLPDDISVNQRDTIAKQMGHNISQQLQYNKIDLE